MMMMMMHTARIFIAKQSSPTIIIHYYIRLVWVLCFSLSPQHTFTHTSIGRIASNSKSNE